MAHQESDDCFMRNNNFKFIKLYKVIVVKKFKLQDLIVRALKCLFENVTRSILRSSTETGRAGLGRPRVFGQGFTVLWLDTHVWPQGLISEYGRRFL